MDFGKLGKIAVVVASVVGLSGCGITKSIGVMHGKLHGGHSADVITAELSCGSGVSVTKVIYDKNGNYVGQSSTSHGDLCAAAAGGTSRIVAGVVTGGATATAEAAATAVAASASQ